MTPQIYEGAEIAEIRATVDLGELLKKVRQIDALKTALESVGRFHENAVKYAKLEAEALIRVAELGGIGQLRGYKRTAAKWLYELSPAERDTYINRCAEGLTIEQVWKRDIFDEEKTTDTITRLLTKRAELVSDLKEYGIVDIGGFTNDVPPGFPAQLRHDLEHVVLPDLLAR